MTIRREGTNPFNSTRYRSGVGKSPEIMSLELKQDLYFWAQVMPNNQFLLLCDFTQCYFVTYLYLEKDYSALRRTYSGTEVWLDAHCAAAPFLIVTRSAYRCCCEVVECIGRTRGVGKRGGEEGQQAEGRGTGARSGGGRQDQTKGRGGRGAN